MTKRSYIRIVTYIFFLLTALIISSITSSVQMQNYKMELEASYQQSLTELGECLDNINTSLTKSLYSNSYAEIYDLSRDLYAQCSTAKNAMSRLPVGQMQMTNTYKFLSQASDYAQYIGRKAEAGEKISEKEHRTIRRLLEYAEKFCDATNDMVSVVENGGMITQQEVRLNNEINAGTLSIGFKQNNKTFEDFPTLLYDGPFSDQVLNKKPRLIESKQMMNKKDCKIIAANALNVSESKLTFEEQDNSKIPSFIFRYGKYTISVSKQGGYVKEIIYSGSSEKQNITGKDASRIATSYLKRIGYIDMVPNYYSINDNVCTVNCVYQKYGVTYYPDIIKVSISLTNGAVVGLDGKTYITNHLDRNKIKTRLSEKDARKLISEYLEIKNVKKAVIPKESGIEASCYEFACISKETGEEALVYINTENGREEDIMLLLKTDNGTFVK